MSNFPNSKSPSAAFELRNNSARAPRKRNSVSKISNEYDSNGKVIKKKYKSAQRKKLRLINDEKS